MELWKKVYLSGQKEQF